MGFQRPLVVFPGKEIVFPRPASFPQKYRPLKIEHPGTEPVILLFRIIQSRSGPQDATLYRRISNMIFSVRGIDGRKHPATRNRR